MFYLLSSASSGLQTSYSTLEAGIVVQGDLIHDIVSSVILILIIGISRTPNKSSIELVGIIVGGVSESCPSTFSRITFTSCSFVVRLQGIIVSKPYNITSARVSQHVAYLLISIGSVDISLDPSIGSL